MNSYTKTQTLKEVAKLPIWTHRIDVGHGITTPGYNDTRPDVERLRLPDDMSGKRVLDIGPADGFFSFLCEQRGGDVTAVDPIEGLPIVDGEHGFKIAAKLRGSSAVFKQLSVYDLDQLGHRFDVVLFLNVLYHLKHPLYGLQKIFEQLNDDGVLYVKSFFYQDFRFRKFGFDIFNKALCRFYESDELNNDVTNWWAPNKRCIEGMLRATGFTSITRLAQAGDRVYYEVRK